jgi:hypothetical protein
VEVVPFEHPGYDDVKLLYEGSTEIVLAVRNDAKQWTLLDTQGKAICDGFQRVWGAHENIIAVMDANEKWGALSPNGIWIFEPRYSDFFTFTQGLARVDRGFYIDKTGREFRAGGRITSEIAGTRCQSP